MRNAAQMIYRMHNKFIIEPACDIDDDVEILYKYIYIYIHIYTYIYIQVYIQDAFPMAKKVNF